MWTIRNAVVEPQRRAGYCPIMDMTFVRAPAPSPNEDPKQRAQRVEREADFIASSHAAIDAGKAIDLDVLLREFDTLDGFRPDWPPVAVLVRDS